MARHPYAHAQVQILIVTGKRIIAENQIIRPSAGRKLEKKKLEWIEYLRAVAICVTVVAHLRSLFPWKATWLEFIFGHAEFWAGVDLFFAISGYVIARDLLRRLDLASSPETRWRVFFSFWIRRAFRILPSAWLWLLIGLVGAAWFNSHDGFGDLDNAIADATAAVLQVANVRLWYCNVHVTCGFNSVYWSLSSEEQFYLLLPMLVLLFKRKLWMPVLCVWIIAMIIPRGALPAWHYSSSLAILARVMRIDAICAGVILALIERRLGTLKTPFNRNFSILLSIVLCASLIFAPVMFESALYLMSIPCFILVWTAATQNGQSSDGLLRKIGLWIGARSYAIYLIHLPVFAIAKEVLLPNIPQSSLGELALLSFSAVLVIVLAEMNFYIIESPLRELGKRIASKMESSSQGGDSIRTRSTASASQ